MVTSKKNVFNRFPIFSLKQRRNYLMVAKPVDATETDNACISLGCAELGCKMRLRKMK